MAFHVMYPYLRVSDLPTRIPLGPQHIRLGDTGYYVSRQCYREENHLKETIRLYVTIDSVKRKLLGYPDDPHVAWRRNEQMPSTANLIDASGAPAPARRRFTDKELYYSDEAEKIQDLITELNGRLSALSYKTARPVGVMANKKGLYLIDLERYDRLPATPVVYGPMPAPSPEGDLAPALSGGESAGPTQLDRLPNGGAVLKKFSFPSRVVRVRTE